MVIEDLLKELIEKGGSDLHISSKLPPVMRLDGRLTRCDVPPLSPEDVENLLFPMMSNEQRRHLEQEWELDFSYGIEGLGRFRVNFYKDNVKGKFQLEKNFPKTTHLILMEAPKEVADSVKKFIKSN